MAFTDALTVTIGNPTRKSDYDSVADNTEFNRTTADQDHDFDISTGTGDHKLRVGEPMHIQVDASTVWTLGMWQSADTRWWLLGNTADVASFTREQAEFYIALGNVNDVPTA